jgi:hypothetical protein
MIQTLKNLFYTKPHNLYTQQIKQETDALLNEFDKEYRLKEINNIPLSKDEFKTNMLYVANHLYEVMINASNAVYRKIQLLEASYSEVKSELDNKLYYELHTIEKQKEELESQVESTKVEIEAYSQEKKRIEKEFNKLEDRKVIGDLDKLPLWVFLAVMLLVGGAELLIYQNVFLSQEIGLAADMPEEKQNQVFWTSMLMSIGFVGMIIWMAHALGKLVRHFANTTPKEKKFYIVKISIILAISAAAIWATVDIRSKMHTILADDNQVKVLKVQKEDSKEATLFGSDDSAGFGDSVEESSDNSNNDDDGFGDDDEEDNEDGGFSEEKTPTSKTEKQPQDIETKIQNLRKDAQIRKENTAYVFVIINLFIFIGGAFLSYFSHTSSPIYEMVESKIKLLEKRKKRYQKEIQALDKKIIKFKKEEINKLFSKLVDSAALYDIHVRTYNAYTAVFKIQLELIESYLREIYKAHGIEIQDSYVTMILSEYITLDTRKELQHVNNIEEYMIYKFQKPQTFKEMKNV